MWDETFQKQLKGFDPFIAILWSLTWMIPYEVSPSVEM